MNSQALKMCVFFFKNTFGLKGEVWGVQKQWNGCGGHSLKQGWELLLCSDVKGSLPVNTNTSLQLFLPVAQPVIRFRG